MSNGSAASVELQSVSKRYGSVTAVDDVSFAIEPGTLVTLLGPSGCGKTTTLRLIAGLEIASSGRIMIGDTDVTLRSAAERDVSMVFQSYALFPHMDVLDNVAYGPTVLGKGRAKARELAMEKLELVGLTGLEKRSPSELSGGQQQRVAVARALVMEPKVLLFDEPLSNLDAKLRRRVRQDIRELQKSLHLTVVYVTHDQEEALAISDRIIVMSNARIAQAGTPRELYEAPADAFIADFIGDANIVDGRMTREKGSAAVVKLGGVEIELPHRGCSVGPVKVALRPHSLGLSSQAPKGPALAGRLLGAAYLGDNYEVTVSTELGELFIVTPPYPAPPESGAEVWVHFDVTGVCLVPPGERSES